MFRKRNVPFNVVVLCFIFSFPLQEAERRGGLPWWVWLLVIIGLLLLVGLLAWWWSRRREEPEAQPQVRAEMAPAPVEKAPPAPDDLTRIEGIGPKIASLLQQAGITTFAQLAETDVDRLRQILDEARLLQIADPGTWPEQARLAAAGQWEALEALQEELKGGRRV